MTRCPFAIDFGYTLTTRCKLAEGHFGNHEGRGLEQFPDQIVEWLPGDRREFESNRTDERAWER
jgi:hypothetical protein